MQGDSAGSLCHVNSNFGSGNIEARLRRPALQAVAQVAQLCTCASKA